MCINIDIACINETIFVWFKSKCIFQVILELYFYLVTSFFFFAFSPLFLFFIFLKKILFYCIYYCCFHNISLFDHLHQYARLFFLTFNDCNIKYMGFHPWESCLREYNIKQKKHIQTQCRRKETTFWTLISQT